MLSGALDSTELQRARSLPEAMKARVRHRAILRTLLGERMEVPAADVMLRKSENGKPSVSRRRRVQCGPFERFGCLCIHT